MSVVFFLCRVRSECREPGAKCPTHGKGVAEPAILCHSLVTSVSVVGLLYFFFFLHSSLFFSGLKARKSEREKLRTAGEEWRICGLPLEVDS